MSILAVLAALFGMLAAVFKVLDFLVTRREDKQLRAQLDVWYRVLESVPARALGLEEAKAALKALDAYFGAPFSWRMLASCALLSIAVGVPLLVSDLFQAPYLAGNNLISLFSPMRILMLAVSVSVTQIVLRWSVQAIGEAKFGTFLFVVVMFANVAATHLVALYAPFLDVFASYVGRGLAFPDELRIAAGDTGLAAAIANAWRWTFDPSLNAILVNDPYPSWMLEIEAGELSGLFDGRVSAWTFSFVTGIVVAGLRLSFALAFLSSWCAIILGIALPRRVLLAITSSKLSVAAALAAFCGSLAGLAAALDKLASALS